MFDKKADPYVVFQLNGETKQAATLRNTRRDPVGISGDGI